MRVRRLPLTEIVTIAIEVVLEDDREDEEEDPFEEDGLKAGTYAMDGEGRLWRLEETLTGLFQELMDAKIKRKK